VRSAFRLLRTWPIFFCPWQPLSALLWDCDMYDDEA
jgi:hypothetical protein